MCGSVVITIMVPKELKEIMDKDSGIINWSEEIRNFIIMQITEIK